jgi:hypothetical protein
MTMATGGTTTTRGSRLTGGTTGTTMLHNEAAG